MIAGYTDKGFRLIDFNSPEWHTDEHFNWTLLDALLEASLGDVALPVVGGTANAITLNYTPDKVLANGTTLVFILTAAPTGATTITVDANPAKNLLVLGTAVAAGDLQVGDTVKAVYDGTDFHTISPLRKFSRLSLIEGSSGASANTDADNLVISSNIHAGISILTPNTQSCSILFGDNNLNTAGYIEYDHATDLLAIGRAGADALVLSASGAFLAVGSFAMNLTGANNLVITESSADVIRIGSSGAATGIQVNVATGNVTILGDLTITGSLTGGINLGSVTGTLGVANGGTGGTTATLARANLGAAASGVITASGLTMSTARLLGRITPATGAVEEITIDSTMLFAAGNLGVASVPQSLTFDDDGTGAAAGTGFNGATARVISYNSVGALPSTPRVQTAGSNSVTPTFSNDIVIRTGASGSISLNNPSGTALDGHGIVIRLKDNGTARAVSFGSQYRAMGVTLPSTTVISKWLYIGMIYNSADTKWDVVSVLQEA